MPRLAHGTRDSFCLVTPNWQCKLPGFAYAHDDPYGFVLRDEIVDDLDDFIASFDPPVLTGVEVLKLRRGQHGEFLLSTSAVDYAAKQMVVAAGG